MSNGGFAEYMPWIRALENIEAKDNAALFPIEMCDFNTSPQQQGQQLQVQQQTNQNPNQPGGPGQGNYNSIPQPAVQTVNSNQISEKRSQAAQQLLKLVRNSPELWQIGGGSSSGVPGIPDSDDSAINIVNQQNQWNQNLNYYQSQNFNNFNSMTIDLKGLHHARDLAISHALRSDVLEAYFCTDQDVNSVIDQNIKSQSQLQGGQGTQTIGTMSGSVSQKNLNRLRQKGSAEDIGKLRKTPTELANVLREKNYLAEKWLPPSWVAKLYYDALHTSYIQVMNYLEGIKRQEAQGLSFRQIQVQKSRLLLRSGLFKQDLESLIIWYQIQSYKYYDKKQFLTSDHIPEFRCSHYHWLEMIRRSLTLGRQEVDRYLGILYKMKYPDSPHSGSESRFFNQQDKRHWHELDNYHPGQGDSDSDVGSAGSGTDNLDIDYFWENLGGDSIERRTVSFDANGVEEYDDDDEESQYEDRMIRGEKQSISMPSSILEIESRLSQTSSDLTETSKSDESRLYNRPSPMSTFVVDQQSDRSPLQMTQRNLSKQQRKKLLERRSVPVSASSLVEIAASVDKAESQFQKYVEQYQQVDFDNDSESDLDWNEPQSDEPTFLLSEKEAEQRVRAELNAMNGKKSNHDNMNKFHPFQTRKRFKKYQKQNKFDHHQHQSTVPKSVSHNYHGKNYDSDSSSTELSSSFLQVSTQMHFHQKTKTKAYGRIFQAMSPQDLILEVNQLLEKVNCHIAYYVINCEKSGWDFALENSIRSSRISKNKQGPIIGSGSGSSTSSSLMSSNIDSVAKTSYTEGNYNDPLSWTSAEIESRRSILEHYLKAKRSEALTCGGSGRENIPQQWYNALKQEQKLSKSRRCTRFSGVGQLTVTRMRNECSNYVERIGQGFRMVRNDLTKVMNTATQMSIRLVQEEEKLRESMIRDALGIIESAHQKTVVETVEETFANVFYVTNLVAGNKGSSNTITWQNQAQLLDSFKSKWPFLMGVVDSSLEAGRKKDGKIEYDSYTDESQQGQKGGGGDSTQQGLDDQNQSSQGNTNTAAAADATSTSTTQNGPGGGSQSTASSAAEESAEVQPESATASSDGISYIQIGSDSNSNHDLKVKVVSDSDKKISEHDLVSDSESRVTWSN